MLHTLVENFTVPVLPFSHEPPNIRSRPTPFFQRLAVRAAPVVIPWDVRVYLIGVRVWTWVDFATPALLISSAPTNFSGSSDMINVFFVWAYHLTHRVRCWLNLAVRCTKNRGRMGFSEVPGSSAWLSYANRMCRRWTENIKKNTPTEMDIAVFGTTCKRRN